MPEFSHLDEQGHARIVDIGDKAPSLRRAVARGIVQMRPETAQLVAAQQVAKGDVLATARIAGIMAAKETSRLVPLCHPIRLDSVAVDFHLDPGGAIEITATARATERTGVEMEALTAVSVAALTIYDMCKGIERGIVIREIRLLEKSGGRSGDWRADHSSGE